MNCQKFMDRGSVPVEIIFGGNQLTGYPLIALLSIISVFKSNRKPMTQSDRTGGV